MAVERSGQDRQTARLKQENFNLSVVYLSERERERD